MLFIVGELLLEKLTKHTKIHRTFLVWKQVAVEAQCPRFGGVLEG